MLTHGHPMVEPILEADAEECGRLLARAFRDNPGVKVVLEGAGPEERLRVATPSFIGFVKGTIKYGRAECVKRDGKVVAASLSVAPGAFPPPIGFDLITMWGPLRAGLRRSLRFLRVDIEMKKRHLKEPHWYLWVLGVEPELQGQGLGSELLRALGARADADRTPCYLETDKPTSVKLYEKHGFRVTSEETLPGVPVHLWLMKR